MHPGRFEQVPPRHFRSPHASKAIHELTHQSSDYSPSTEKFESSRNDRSRRAKQIGQCENRREDSIAERFEPKFLSNTLMTRATRFTVETSSPFRRVKLHSSRRHLLTRIQPCGGRHDTPDSSSRRISSARGSTVHPRFSRTQYLVDSSGQSERTPTADSVNEVTKKK